jgi:hypothetical protein
MYRELTVQEAIEAAKKKVIQTYEHKDTTERKWVESHLDACNSHKTMYLARPP